MVAAVAVIGTLWTSVAMATITQGDFSVFGFFETRNAGHWGEGSASRDSTATTLIHPTRHDDLCDSRQVVRAIPAAVSISIIGIWLSSATLQTYVPTIT